jgi:TetR/AcrR family transcriptional regulator
MTEVIQDSGTARRDERRSQRKDLSRTQLLDAAEEVFGQKGFRDATLKEVAERAGYSVGSVYSFFDSKDDLLAKVYERRGREFMPRLREILVADGDPIAQLHELVMFQVEFFRIHPSFGRLYLFQSGHLIGTDGNPPFDAEIIANFDEAMVLQTGLFERGQQAGTIRPGDPAVLSRLFSGLMAAYQQTDARVLSGDPSVPERLATAELQALITKAFEP